MPLFNKLMSWTYYPWLVWGLAASVFLIEYFVRVAPSVMVDPFMSEFHVKALAVGSLSACFYYTYVAMQVPVGLLLDSLNVRWILTTMALLCAIGCFYLANTTSFTHALLARLLSGFGAAFAFIGALKLVSIWFKPNQFGMLAGLTQALGMLGAGLGQTAMAVWVNQIGWRSTLYLISGALVIITVAFAVIVRNRERPEIKQVKLAPLNVWAGFMVVLKNPQNWWNALVIGLLYAPTVIIAELWGVKFLVSTYHLTINNAALSIGMIFLGWMLAGPVSGWISDRLRRRRLILILSILFSFIFINIFLFVPQLSLGALWIILFCYGVANTGVAASYAIAAEINSPALSGTSVAFANMASVLVGSLLQPIVGWLIDRNGVMENGLIVHTAKDFRIAMVVLPICLVIALFIALLIRERSVIAEEEREEELATA